MLTYTNYRSFAEVVAHYDSITPLRGSNNAGKDIRPIGDRSRKHERIVKISESCYALSDGYHFGDEHFGYWYRGEDFTPTLADMEKYAPIVWRKKRDGTEEVTLRNGWGPGSHNSRYNFLYRHSPKFMLFQIRNGKHFIETGRSLPGTGTTRYYLAKTTTMPKAMHDKFTNNQHYKWATTRDDNSAVKFIRIEGGWQHVEGTGRSLPKAPTVNKDLKAKFKDDIKKFFEWGMAMSPLLPLGDREYSGIQMADLYAAYGQKPMVGGVQPAPTIARAIVRDDQHDARLALWVLFAKDCTDGWSWNAEYLTKTVETKEDLAKVRSRYNTFINKQLGFMQN
jgi:hypothetical protein